MPKLIRISGDTSKAIVKDQNLYSVIDTNTKNLVGVSEHLSKLTEEGIWYHPTPKQKIELTPVVAAGMSEYERRKKARNQPRDGAGRWVSAGANVRWRSNGQDWSGTVEKIVDGLARVKVRHKDGSESYTSLLPSTISVMNSKARLSSNAKKYWDHDNNTEQWIGQKKGEVVTALDENPEAGATMEREDGYGMDIKKRKKPEDTNALIYQLYAPNGNSLGIYDEEAEGDFDDIFEEDQSGVPAEGEGSEGSEGTGGSSEGGEGGGEGESAPVGPSAPAATVASLGVSKKVASFTVPKAVRESIQSALDAGTSELSMADRAYANRLCSGNPVTRDEVDWVGEFYRALEEYEDVYGGPAGRKWAKKINSAEPEEVTPYHEIEHDFYSGEFDYFGAGPSEYMVNTLIAIHPDFDSVFVWRGNQFSVSPENSTVEFDAPYIEHLDPYTAEKFAHILRDESTETTAVDHDIMDFYPEERNLFALADPEMDYDLLGNLTSLANGDYDGYERSKDATKQPRQTDNGRFGKVPDSDKNPATQADDSSSMEEARYFAIVDEVDQSAVMDIVALTQVNGVPAAFRRSGGAWSPDPAMLASLEGNTPPSVVHLEDETEIKDVLTQIDEYDSERAVTSSAYISRGYALQDGTFRISNEKDLNFLIKHVPFSEMTEDQVIHVSKRAFSLNRSDLIPEELRTVLRYSVSEEFMGEYGEVITASAGRQLVSGNFDQLSNYFLRSPKIDWDAEDAIIQATKVFAKYTPYAEGLALLLHNKHENSNKNNEEA